MYNCIFTPHCTEILCDKSCPTLVETSYLLERNNIRMNSKVFSAPQPSIDKMLQVIEDCEGTLGVYVANKEYNTVEAAELLTYCGICSFWRGSRLHCTVYNLRYSKYLDDLKRSWSNKDNTDDLEYTQIWSASAKLLVVSAIDYVNFGDFECQTLLNLLQERQKPEFTTIVVSPPIRSLVSSKSSPFFTTLKSILVSAAKVVK